MKWFKGSKLGLGKEIRLSVMSCEIQAFTLLGESGNSWTISKISILRPVLESLKYFIPSIFETNYDWIDFLNMFEITVFLQHLVCFLFVAVAGLLFQDLNTKGIK